MSQAALHIVVLAAGKGSRMRSSKAKVLHALAGKPLLGHVLAAAGELEPHTVHVVVGHDKDAILSAFENQEITWVEQHLQLGTADAVKQAMPGIPDDANVLMLTADVPLINSASLKLLYDSMATSPLAMLTAAVADPSGLGRILRDESNDVCGIIEHKDASSKQRQIDEINSGIMCARGADLKRWLASIKSDNVQQEFYLTDIVALAYQEGAPISAFQPLQNHEVEGINTRQQLAQVERLYQRDRANQLMADGVSIMDPARIDIRGEVTVGADSVIDINCVIEGPTQIGNNVQIGPNCVISACRIADGATVHANSVLEQAVLGEKVNVGPFARLRPGTELADGVRIGNFVETKNAKFAAGAKANHLSYVGDATVGNNTNIGAGVITCNYDGAFKHQTTIGDDVFVGSDSQLIAPVNIGDGATVGAGSTVSSDVSTDQLVVSRARQRHIDGWQRPSKKNKSKK